LSQNKKRNKVKKAYENEKFINSYDGRIVRIICEYLEPRTRLRKHRIKDTIVFFGSARTLPREDAAAKLKKARQAVKEKPKSKKAAEMLKTAQGLWKMVPYYEAAEELSSRLTLWSKSLKHPSLRFIITTGGGDGIMGAASKGAMDSGGHSIGFNIALPFEQESNPHVTPDLQFEFNYFFMRKFWFAYLAKALIIFPGGFGTMDELMELLTLVQTQKIKKPIPTVLYGGKYWKEVINFKKMVEWGTISTEDLKLFRLTDSVDEAFHFLTKELRRIYL